MKIIKHHFPINLFHSNITDQYFHGLKLGLLDIETTGLSPQHNQVILGGLLIPDETGVTTVQYFAESLADEADLLKRYCADLSALDVLISYNGCSFDLPFLVNRCTQYGIEFRYCSSQNFDLYRVIKNHSDLKKFLPNLKQKTIENFLGLWSNRTDEISGAESVLYYEEYIRNHDQKLEAFILLHNSDDLLQLSKLLSIIKKLDLHKIMFHNGMIVAHKDKRIYAETIRLYRNRIKVTGMHRNISPDYRCYQESYEAHFSAAAEKFLLKIPVYAQEDLIYVDLTEFSSDYSVLERFGGYFENFLILQRKNSVNYCEINRLIQIILQDIIENV